MNVDPACAAAVDTTVTALASAGHHVVDTLLTLPPPEAHQDHVGRCRPGKLDGLGSVGGLSEHLKAGLASSGSSADASARITPPLGAARFPGPARGIGPGCHGDIRS